MIESHTHCESVREEDEREEEDEVDGVEYSNL